MKFINIESKNVRISLWFSYIILVIALSILNFLAILNNAITLKYEIEGMGNYTENEIELNYKFIKSYMRSSEMWMQNQIELLMMNIIFIILIVFISFFLIQHYKRHAK